jgi:hypothetical protein
MFSVRYLNIIHMTFMLQMINKKSYKSYQIPLTVSITDRQRIFSILWFTNKKNCPWMTADKESIYNWGQSAILSSPKNNNFPQNRLVLLAP